MPNDDLAVVCYGLDGVGIRVEFFCWAVSLRYSCRVGEGEQLLWGDWGSGLV